LGVDHLARFLEDVSFEVVGLKPHDARLVEDAVGFSKVVGRLWVPGYFVAKEPPGDQTHRLARGVAPPLVSGTKGFVCGGQGERSPCIARFQGRTRCIEYRDGDACIDALMSKRSVGEVVDLAGGDALFGVFDRESVLR